MTAAPVRPQGPKRSSTSTGQATPIIEAQGPSRRSFGGLLGSEWMNLRSTPTAPTLLGGSMVMAAASCTANLAAIDDAKLADRATLEQAMHASTVATLVFALVAGVVLSTSDFRFGRVDQLLLSEPSRSRLLGVKATVGAVLGAIYGIFGAAVALAAVTIFMRTNDVALDYSSAAIWDPLIGVVLGASLFAMIGIGLGTAVQNQPAAIAGALASMLIVEPAVILGLPDVARWLPGASGLALTVAPDGNLLAQWPGALMLLGWTMLALLIAQRRFASTDL